MFQPSFLGISACGIHDRVFNSIMKLPKFMREEIYQNIEFHGNSTLFKGFSERLQLEIEYLAPTNTKINIEKNSSESSFLGAKCLLQILNESKNGWFTKEEYDEFGPSLSHLRNGTIHPNERNVDYKDWHQANETDFWIPSKDLMYNHVTNKNQILKKTKIQKQLPNDLNIRFE